MTNSVELDKGKALTDREKAERNKLQTVVFIKTKDGQRSRCARWKPVSRTTAYLEVKKGVRTRRGDRQRAPTAPSAALLKEWGQGHARQG